jgi:hypothetical protein
MSNSTGSNIYSDEERGMVEILNSMGIGQYDSMVPVALNEYARSMFNLFSLS